MSRTLAGAKRFESIGRSARSRGLPWYAIRQPFSPMWVQRALARGYLWQSLTTHATQGAT